MLARAYHKKINKNPKQINQNELKRVVELMQQNIFDEPNKSENIRKGKNCWV